MKIQFRTSLINASHMNSTELHNETSSTETSTLGLEYTILAVMIIALSINGLIGNMAVFIVYFRRRDNLASNTFIKVLASIDLLVCLFVMPYTVVYEFHLVTSDVMCRFCELLLHFCIFASNITLVAIAVERYIAVCQISFMVDANSISVGIGVIVGLSAVLGVPSVGTFAVVQSSDVRDVICQYPHEYATEKFCHFTYSIMGKTFVNAYQGFSAILFYLTVLIIVILYSIVYYVLWKKAKIRGKMLQRTVYNSDTDAVSSALSGGVSKRIQHGQSSEGCITRTTFSDSTSIELKTDNLLDSQNNQDKADKRRKKTRCKIKLSVGVRSGRSEKMKRKMYYHKRTAKMLFLCTITYFVTWLPFWIDVLGLTNFLLLRYLFFFGNATNPIVYGIVNEQVRRAFKKLLRKCLRKCYRIRNFENVEDFFKWSSSSARGTSNE